MTTQLEQAARLALEALVKTDAEPGSKAWEREAEAITAIRAALHALEQPAQDEPVAKIVKTSRTDSGFRAVVETGNKLLDLDTSLYTRHQALEPLDAGEISRLWKQHTNEDGPHFLPYEDDGLGFARAIEQAHGIKGEA